MKKSRALVLGYIEGVSSKIFESYSKQIADLAGHRQGVYALYKGKRLYYVGLATNLKNRVNYHLRDKHAGKWTHFSLYLVRRSQHIKELESLVLRIADPRGNAVKGKLPGAVNYEKDLHRKVRVAYEEELRHLFSRRFKNRTLIKSTKKSRYGSLGENCKKPFTVKGWCKGKEYRARVLTSGEVVYAGKRYEALSSAGRAALKRGCNGWWFWRFKKNGEWVRMKEWCMNGG